MDNNINDMNLPQPTREDYRLIIERQWADIHHSRIQEWTALGVITGIHLGIIQIPKLAHGVVLPFLFSVLCYSAFIICIAFTILGSILTCRHRRLMEIKLSWIFQAEDKLGLIKGKCQNNEPGIIPRAIPMNNQGITERAFWEKLSLPRLLSTSGIIFCFYILLFIIDAFATIVFTIH